MAAAKYNITIEQGTDFARQMTFKTSAGVAIDVSGDTFSGKIRTSYTAVSELVSFTFDVTQASAGIVSFTLTDTQTIALPSTVDIDPYVYDIERVMATYGTVSRVLKGKVKVDPEATK
jgi:hypothetical protein